MNTIRDSYLVVGVNSYRVLLPGSISTGANVQLGTGSCTDVSFSFVDTGTDWALELRTQMIPAQIHA